MSLLKANAVQLGQSLTATNNFTLYQPASPDGTVRLGNGNSGSVTDLVTLTSAGALTLSGALSVTGNTTIGDAAGDTLTINGTAVSIPNNLNFDSNTLFIDAANNAVGIGTSSPGAKLDVLGSNATASDWNNVNIASKNVINSANRIYTALKLIDSGASDAGAIGYSYNGSGYNMMFATVPSVGGAITERMRIDSSGNVGIGTSSPASLLHVNSASASAVATVQSTTYAVFRSKNSSRSVDYASDGTGGYIDIGGAPFRWYNGASEYMRLDSSGNVGIGTSSPSYKFQVIGSSSSTKAAFGSATNPLSAWFYSIDGGETDLILGATATNHSSANIIVQQASIPLCFYTSNLERMRIDSSGNLLVGQTTASYTTLGSSMRANGAINSASSSDFWNSYSTAAGAYRFYVTNVGTVYATNTTISAISDQRLKENIQDLDAGLGSILALKPRKFDWKEGKGKGIKGDRGFIAQEFEQVFPDLIDTWKDEPPEGEEPYKSVRQDLIPVMVKAIQELHQEIELLKSKLN